MSRSEKAALLKRLNKRWIKIAAGLFLLTTLFFLLLPVAAKIYCIDWLEKNGAEKASIERLLFNPFTAKLSLEGVDIIRDGKPSLTNGAMNIDLNPLALFKKDVHLQQVVYRDLFLEVEQDSEGRWRLGSYTFPEDSSGKDQGEDETSSTRWAFLNDHALFENCTVVLVTPQLDLKLHIDNGELLRITTREGRPAGVLRVNGSLNDEKLSLTIDRIQLVPELQLNGSIQLQGFDFAEVQTYLTESLPTFEGKVALDGQISVKIDSQGELDGGYDGTISLSGINLGNSDFSLNSEATNWQGKVSYHNATSAQKISTDGAFKAAEIDLQLPDKTLTLQDSMVELAGKSTISIGERLTVEHDGHFHSGPARFNMPGLMLSDKSLKWQGTTRFDNQTTNGEMVVTTAGKLDWNVVECFVENDTGKIDSDAEEIIWQGDLSYTTGSDISTVKLNGEINGKRLHSSLDTPAYSFELPRAKLAMDYQLHPSEPSALKGSGGFELQDLKVLGDQPSEPLLSIASFTGEELIGEGNQHLSIAHLEVNDVSANIPGQLPLELNLDQAVLKETTTADLSQFLSSELNLTQIDVISSTSGMALVNLGSLQLKGLTAGIDTSIGVEEGKLEQLVALGETGEQSDTAAFRLNSAEMQSFTYSADQIPTIATLHLHDLVTRIIRDSDGELDISQSIAAMQKSPAESPPTPEVEQQNDQESSAGTGLPIFIKELVIDGKSDVFFEDYTLPVPFKTDLSISQFVVTGLESSESDQELKLQLKGQLEKRAPLKLKGSLHPFGEAIQTALTLDMKNYPLKNLSAYTVQAVGTGLASGQLEVSTDFKLDGKMLDVGNSLLFKKLKTKTISKELAEELDNELPIPLDSALNILRDNKDNISLDIPISGSIDDINIDITDLIVTALGKAIIPAATGYLTYALGPYAALAYVGFKVGEKMLQVDLPPIEYSEKLTEIPQEKMDYLNRVATILQEREKSTLQLCPHVAVAEMAPAKKEGEKKGATPVPLDEKMTAELEQLGQERALLLKEFYVQEHGVDGERLLICDTTVEEDPSAISAVKLHF